MIGIIKFFKELITPYQPIKPIRYKTPECSLCKGIGVRVHENTEFRDKDVWCGCRRVDGKYPEGNWYITGDTPEAYHIIKHGDEFPKIRDTFEPKLAVYINDGYYEGVDIYKKHKGTWGGEIDWYPNGSYRFSHLYPSLQEKIKKFF